MFKWDLEYLKRIKSQILERIKETDDYTLQQSYKEQLLSVNYILDYYLNNLKKGINFKKRNIKMPTFKSIILNDREILRDYQSYNNIVFSFRNELRDLDFKGNLSDSKINRSSSLILSITEDFFSQFKGEIGSAFKILKKRLNKTLNFQKIDADYRIMGQTLPIFNSNVVFFDIRYNNTIQDFLTTIHELGHGINHVLNKNILNDWKKYCILEVETYFWELVALDYLDANTKWHKQVHNAKINSLRSHLYNAKLIWAKNNLYTHLSLGNLLNRKVLGNYIKENSKDFKDINIEYIKSESIADFYPHTVSFVIALELYLIYLNNPELALNKLLKISKAHSLSIEEYYNLIKGLGIEPNKNMRLYVDMLMQEEREKGYAKTLYYRN